MLNEIIEYLTVYCFVFVMVGVFSVREIGFKTMSVIIEDVVGGVSCIVHERCVGGLNLVFLLDSLGGGGGFLDFLGFFLDVELAFFFDAVNLVFAFDLSRMGSVSVSQSLGDLVTKVFFLWVCMGESCVFSAFLLDSSEHFCDWDCR